MKTIEIDDETYNYLSSRAIPYTETTPGDTIKRLLGLTGESLIHELNNLQHPESQDHSIKHNQTLQPLYARGKKRKTNLPELIRAGLLKNGQKLIMRDYKGNEYPQYHIIVANGSLIWENKAYSMSDLAKTLLNSHNYYSESVRGPYFFLLESNGKSILDIWNKYTKGEV